MRDLRWLQEMLLDIEDVRSASTKPDPTVIFQPHTASLVVRTWMGARLYLYCVHKAPRLREIRSLLKENSRSGIGTFFLPDLTLLPVPDEAFYPQDWLLALQMLGGGCLYASYRASDGPAIAMVGLRPAEKQGQYRAEYRGNLHIRHVSVRERAHDEPVRGVWYVGDLTTPPYQRTVDHDRAGRRFHYDTRKTREVYTPPADQLVLYYRLLGLEQGATQAEVKSAYRRLALKLHPDVSEYPPEEAEQRFKTLKEAYECKKYHDWS